MTHVYDAGRIRRPLPKNFPTAIALFLLLGRDSQALRTRSADVSVSISVVPWLQATVKRALIPPESDL
jgi:hypothetical protein